MLKITVQTGDLSEKLDRLPDNVKAALLAEAGQISALLLGIVRAKASGDVLQVHTGGFLASIQSKVKENPKSVVGQVFSKDPRAGVLEWGGHTPPRDIAPKNAHALHFLGNSGEVFAGLVHNPGAQIKPHSIFHSTYVQEKDDVAARLINAGTHAATSSV